MKQILSTSSKLCLLLLFGLLLSHPKQTASDAAAGLATWYTTVVPVLLPAMILSGLLIRTKACHVLHPLFAPLFTKIFQLPEDAADAFLVGVLCGYPSGAAITGELLRQNRLTRLQAVRLLQFCNYPSPMFLTGLVLRTALHGQTNRFSFLLAIYLSGLCTGILTACTAFGKPAHEKPAVPAAAETAISGTFFEKLEAALMTAAKTILFVGLYLMLFRILSGMIATLLPLPPLLLAVSTGLLDMTSGVLLLSALPLPAMAKESLMLFLCVFGGLSTWLQAVSVANCQPFPSSRYLCGRLLHAGLAVLLFTLFSLLPP